MKTEISWTTEKRKVSDLIPADYNPRTIGEKEKADLMASVVEFGKVVPVIVNVGKRNNRLIGGHQRVQIYADLGEQDTEIDVRVPNRELSLEEEKELNIRLNKNTGDWDWERLNKAFKMDELTKWGFEKQDVSKAWDKIAGINNPKVEDVPPIPKDPVSKRGEKYQLGPHVLLCGDSTNPEDVKRLMGGSRANMVFTDPPWNVAIGLDSNPKHRQREGLINDNLGADFPAFLSALSSQIALYCDGDIYCVMGCEQWPAVHGMLTKAGLHWSATIIWLKDQFVLGRSKFHRRYEPIWYGWKDKSSFCGGRDKDDVWEIPRPKRSEDHPTMKPVELCERAITYSSNRGDIVLDLFLGAGSTLIAAQNTERICYGMEIDPQYVDVIIRRWENFTGQKAVKIE